MCTKQSAGLTDCDRCGSARPADPSRLTVAFQDSTNSSQDGERVFVCGDCWNRLLELTRKVSHE